MWGRGRVGGSPTAAAQEPSSAHHSPGSDSLAARRRGGPQTNREVESSSELSQAQRKVARLPRAERGEVRDLAPSPRLLARSGALPRPPPRILATATATHPHRKSNLQAGFGVKWSDPPA